MSITQIELGEKTKLFLNNKERASLRTIVPMSIVRQWGLEVGDHLDWSWEVIKDDMIVRVRKAKK